MKRRSIHIPLLSLPSLLAATPALAPYLRFKPNDYKPGQLPMPPVPVLKNAQEALAPNWINPRKIASA